MKKLIVAVAVLVGVGYLAKRFAPKFPDVDWEWRFAAMPDNACLRSGCFAISPKSMRTPTASSNCLRTVAEEASEPPKMVDGNANVKVLTVYADQNPRSFCHGVLERFTAGLGGCWA